MRGEIILRAVLIGAGAAGLPAAVLALAKKRITETVCAWWGAGSLLLILLGLPPYPAGWDLSAPALGPALAAGLALWAAAVPAGFRASDSARRRERAAMEDALRRFEGGAAREKELLVILPAYNEEKSLPALLERLEEAGVRDFADLLVLDDGSSDGTARLAEALGCPCVRGVHLGYGRTLQTGYLYAVRAGYRFVIQADADGQHDPCNIETLYRSLQTPGEDGEPPDVVLGSRFLPGGQSFPMPGVKLLSIRMFRLALRLAGGQRITDPTTGLQGLSARTAAYYAGEGNFDSRYPDANMILQMLLRGFRVREVPAVMHQRKAGQGMYIGLKPFAYMFHMAFSMAAVYVREALLAGKAEG